VELFRRDAAREPTATSAPSMASTSASTSPMGVERSASVMRTSGSLAASIPARTAAPLPRFSSKAITFTFAPAFEPAANSSATFRVASREPSSTTTISRASRLAFPYAATARRVGGSRSASLNAGMTTDRRRGRTDRVLAPLRLADHAAAA
jgi:hypothetical protein